MKGFLLAIICFLTVQLYGQLITHPDTIRGALRFERTCFDVVFYDLSVKINPDSQFISGENQIHVKILESTSKIQLDLFKTYTIQSVELHQSIGTSGLNEIIQLQYAKVANAFFIEFPEELKKGTIYKIVVKYSGKPKVAKKAPWDGGFVWKKDSFNRHFCGVACEGLGASSWWPCKDHLSDEPDSMNMTFIVPEQYMCVSNGQFVGEATAHFPGDSLMNWKAYRWKVINPINSYNVTYYLGKFNHIEDWYISNGDSLKLDYYMLDYNTAKAKAHFKQVKPMLKIYEDLFGKYPFWEDGYKLVEAPYLGMEHQSAIAYGNHYKPGYWGHHPKGIDFDYIIVHESGHEYWGNSVSMSDLADMWIHESFCTYTEVLYTEKLYGDSVVPRYLSNQRNSLENDKPIIGQYGVNEEGSSDMYAKGALMLHTIRNYVNNDSLWFATIKQFHEDFKLKTTNTNEVLQWFENVLGKEVRLIFERYLYRADLPVLQIKTSKFLWWKRMHYKWKNEADALPLHVVFKKMLLTPTKEWQKVRVKSFGNLHKQFIWHYTLCDVEELENH